MIAVDANVAVKWYIPEAGTDAALDLMHGPTLLIAPDLIRLEVLAAITRRVRMGESTEAEAKLRCDDWLRHLGTGAVSLLPEQEVLGEALGLSLGIRHALQDCLYLAAAKRRGVPLVTADGPFHDRARAVYPDIRLLPGCRTS